MNEEVTAIIGMEIHVELATETKMFCRCRNNFADPPNTNVCPVCLALPGSLPVMNKPAVEFSIKAALALNCRIASFTKWDRKGYYYPDLPKNYQISQYDLPIGEGGYLEFPIAGGESKKVRITRAHLEEDAGKNVHDNAAFTGVDLNRAGVPLLEIVSEPDIHTSAEAGAYARAMQRIVRWLGVSHANMQMGHMRFEPNINLHISSGQQTYKTPIVEVKNLNSFRALEGAISFEIDRQYTEWQADREGYSLSRVGKQNRGWDDERMRTVFQRGKEDAHDYRYFPDPDLVGVCVDDTWRDSIAGQIGELPLARRERFIERYELSFKDADALTQDAPTGDLLDKAISSGADAKKCANLLLGRGSAAANKMGCSIAETGVTSENLAELAGMLTSGKINATASAKIFDLMIENGGRPGKIAQDQQLLAVTDTGELEKWVDEAISQNPQAVEDVVNETKKRDKAFNFLLGQVMRKSRGAAPPGAVRELFEKKLIT